MVVEIDSFAITRSVIVVDSRMAHRSLAIHGRMLLEESEDLEDVPALHSPRLFRKWSADVP